MFGLEGTDALIVNIAIVVGNTMIAGIMSGLTLGLFSLDENYLHSLAEGTKEKQRRQAQAVLEVIKSPHWVLVTVLLCNAAAIESMPLVLDELLNPIAAIAISTVLVLIFGEIIPQALFVKHALPIGAFFSIPLRCVMYATAPVSWTIGKLLDILVGHREAVLFRRRELKEFLLLQEEMLFEQQAATDTTRLLGDSNTANVATGHESETVADEEQQKITKQEINIMLGALSLEEKFARDVMTPLADVVSLEADDKIDKTCIERLFTCGFSRILVHEGSDRSSICGYLITKTLVPLIYKAEERAPVVKDLSLSTPLRCSEYTPLSEVFQRMQAGSSHIAVVEALDDDDDDSSSEQKHLQPPNVRKSGRSSSARRQRGGRALGIITAHDILEQIHQKNFTDEMDLRQNAPVQVIMKTWSQLQMRKQILSSIHFRQGEGSKYLSAPGSAGLTRASAQHRLGRSSRAPLSDEGFGNHHEGASPNRSFTTSQRTASHATTGRSPTTRGPKSARGLEYFERELSPRSDYGSMK